MLCEGLLPQITLPPSPGLFKNIPHVWFLRLYSLIKNPQIDFPKMRGDVNGRLELFRKFIRFGRVTLPKVSTDAAERGLFRELSPVFQRQEWMMDPRIQQIHPTTI